MNYLFPDSVLLVFCKAPVAGQVKTRLQPLLTAEQAAEAHKRLTCFTLDRAFQQPLCEVRLYCAPNTEHAFFRQCGKDYPLVLYGQCGENLGERMYNAFCDALSCFKHAILIGCDCPSLTGEDLRQALSYLESGKDCVIAPAADGGYVLIGLNAVQPHLFENIGWGGENVMADTLDRAAEAAISVQQLKLQWDVDTPEDWRRFLAEFNVF